MLQTQDKNDQDFDGHSDKEGVSCSLVGKVSNLGNNYQECLIVSEEKSPRLRENSVPLGVLPHVVSRWREFQECKALAKRYSQLKPTRAKLQNQNLHRWVAKRYRQVEPARKKTIQLSDYHRAVT